MKFEIDLSRPAGERVSWVHLNKPYEPSPINTSKVRVITTRYIAAGKAGYTMLGPKNIMDHSKGPLDIDVFKWYLLKKSPVGRNTIVGDRITIKDGTYSSANFVHAQNLAATIIFTFICIMLL